MTYAAGCQFLHVLDPVLNLTFPLYLFYPTQAAATPTAFGPYSLEVAMQASAAPADHGLILISHGSGGSPLVYRLLALHLAQQGFAVACPEHPYNNRNDNTWEGTLNNLQHRPRHLQLALEATIAHPDLDLGLNCGLNCGLNYGLDKGVAKCVAHRQVGVVGHSMGGYTALALAGGAPHTQRQQPALAPQAVHVPHDQRIGALVLLAPATVWFAPPGNLDQVAAPTLLVSGAKDTQIPPWQMEALVGLLAPGVLTAHQHVPNAGHYSFLSPFPESFPARSAAAGFPPAQDPPGFDREAFAPQLNQTISAHFTHHLLGA